MNGLDVHPIEADLTDQEVLRDRGGEKVQVRARVQDEGPPTEVAMREVGRHVDAHGVRGARVLDELEVDGAAPIHEEGDVRAEAGDVELGRGRAAEDA